MLAAQWTHTINSVVQSTLLLNFQNPNTGPFLLFGLNPGIQNLATLSHLSSAHRPIRATAGEDYLSCDKISQKIHPPLKSIHDLPCSNLAFLSKTTSFLMRNLDFWKLLKSSKNHSRIISWSSSKLLEAPRPL